MEEYEFNEMEMPTPCQHCNEWFDLNDGYGSEKWYPNTTICADCWELEKGEIQMDEEIKEMYEELSEAFDSAKRLVETLNKMGKEINPEIDVLAIIKKADKWDRFASVVPGDPEAEVAILRVKAEKWDKLDEEISKFYENEEDQEDYSGGLIEIGETAARALGYL